MLKNIDFDKPDVSVYISAKDAEDTIGRAVTAALTQTDLKVEVIVRDDGSTDNTAKVAEEYGAKVYRNSKNIGVAKSLNRTLPYCTGRYFFNTDADDFIEPDALTTLVTLADMTVDTTGNYKNFFYGNTLYYEHGKPSRTHVQGQYNSSDFYKRNPVCSDILVPAQAFTLDGIKYIEERYIHEDWAYMLSLIEAGYKFNHVNTLVLHYFYTAKGNYATVMENDPMTTMRKYFRIR